MFFWIGFLIIQQSWYMYCGGHMAVTQLSWHILWEYISFMYLTCHGAYTVVGSWLSHIFDCAYNVEGWPLYLRSTCVGRTCWCNPGIIVIVLWKADTYIPELLWSVLGDHQHVAPHSECIQCEKLRSDFQHSCCRYSGRLKCVSLLQCSG